MASFEYRLNPLYPVKECSSCGVLYTTDYCCSDGSPGDKIICNLDKTPDLSQRPHQNYPKCGNPVNGHYCQGCALLRKKFKENLFTYCIENGIIQDASKPSNDNTNVVNALQEPFVVEQDPGENSSQSPPQINHCCYGCEEQEANIDTQPFQYSVVPQPPQEELMYITTLNWDHHTVCYYDDDDEDYAIAVTPSLSTEEPDHSLSMRDEHLDTVLTTESNEFIKSSVENLVLIPNESEGIPDNMCDVPFHENSPPLDVC
nr:hypothetical protein [Tanacetum cinerariifolium]